MKSLSAQLTYQEIKQFNTQINRMPNKHIMSNPSSTGDNLRVEDLAEPRRSKRILAREAAQRNDNIDGSVPLIDHADVPGFGSDLFNQFIAASLQGQHWQHSHNQKSDQFMVASLQLNQVQLQQCLQLNQVQLQQQHAQNQQWGSRFTDLLGALERLTAVQVNLQRGQEDLAAQLAEERRVNRELSGRLFALEGLVAGDGCRAAFPSHRRAGDGGGASANARPFSFGNSNSTRDVDGGGAAGIPQQNGGRNAPAQRNNGRPGFAFGNGPPMAAARQPAPLQAPRQEPPHSPPEFVLDEATRQMYEAELAAAAAMPLPEDDDSVL